MTEEKKKPEEDEVSEEKLKDVSGGIIDVPSKLNAPPKSPDDDPDMPNQTPVIGIIDIPS